MDEQHQFAGLNWEFPFPIEKDHLTVERAFIEFWENYL